MQAGVDFKQIWAWEVSAQEPKQYWDDVPDTYKQRLRRVPSPTFPDVKHPDLI